LANEIQVSRTPVRDALLILETDGLVTINAHLGASVKKMDLKEFR
jgi:DNA-binding GntR family transcriptional regulator